MNKSEFVKELRERTGLSAKVANDVCDNFVAIVKDAMKSGEKLNLTGFGVFEAKTRAARVAMNPATKEKIELPATKVPAFKAAKLLKDELNK